MADGARQHGFNFAHKPLTISASVRMVGNSVSPPPLAAIARANLDTTTADERMAA